MRAVLWDLLLLLLCLLARARGDCRGDCLHCDRQLYRDSFDVLVSAPAAPSSPGGIGLPDGGNLGSDGEVPPAVTVTPPWAPGRSRGRAKIPNRGGPEQPRLSSLVAPRPS